MNRYDDLFHYDPRYWQIDRSQDALITIKPIRPGWQGTGETRILSNGIIIGRSNIRNAGAADETASHFRCFLGLHIVLNAGYDIHASQYKAPIMLRAGQIWRRAGDFGEIRTSWCKPVSHRVLSLDFTPELFERWQEDFALPDWLQPGYSPELLINCRRMADSRSVMVRAAQILAQPAITLSDTLALEGMTLMLCSELFGLSPGNGRNDKIDDVIDLIRAQYHLPLTISTIAERVGMNECYLKRQFKEKTGTTIAAYIRQLRMNEAMRLLLDEHKTLQETAYYVGYRSPGHFSKVFKNTFGCSPQKVS